MKIIVVKPSGGAFNFVTTGFINSFNDSGMEARYWDGKNERDFLEFNPDLYIGSSGHRQKIPKSWDGKIAIHVNPYGDRLEPLFGVDINEPKHAIEWTLNQNPNIVFGYGLQEDGLTYWKNWEKHGIKFVGCPAAGDCTVYYPEPKDVDYKVVFLGGKWNYKGNSINKWLVPSINKLGDKISIKGWGGWQGVKQYKGVLPQDDSGRTFLSSAMVGPCVCEPHTAKYGIDIPERFFKVALCGTLPIIDKIVGFDRYCDNFIMASSPDDYYSKILNYSSNPDYIDEGIEIASEIRNEVLSKHTYHHRMANLCKSLGFYQEADKLHNRIFNWQTRQF